MVTMLCFALECTRLIRCYVYTCRWACCTFARLLMWISWLFLKSSNNSSLLFNMKDNLSESCSQNPIYCMGCNFTCYSVAAIKWQDFDLGINQVSTLSCNQTCQLDVKFMQHCCKWTNSWLVHVTSSQVNLCLLLHAFCMFHAINLWSSSCTLVPLNHQFLNVFNMLWSNNNSWLRSCSHNYKCMHCWKSIAITNWSVGFHPDCNINSILSFKDS